MSSVHDQAQRESQPVPYWPGQENPLVDALQRGILRESSDFNARGVLSIKSKPALPPAPKQLLPFEKQRLEPRPPLLRLDKATPPPDAAVAVLCAEVAALELANATLESRNASMATQLEIHRRIFAGFCDLYELEHSRP